MEELPDGLLHRARAGDAEAFTLLIRECDEAMRAMVFSVVGDRWLMDDVLQLAYEKAFRAIASFRGDSAFRTWLHRVCWTTAIDVMRAEGRRRHLPIEEAELRPSSAPGPASSVESRLAWDAAWARLDPDHRAALVLVVGEGLTYEEAAEVFGVRPGTVASRLSRARGRLREALGGHEDFSDEEGLR
jgi:RNA polymerase sigma-70 factor (ECF subfamily)